MLFKVYAQNCVRPKGMRIMEATENDLKVCSREIFDEAVNDGLIDITSDEEEDKIDDTKVDEAYHAIENYWNSNRRISSGDYMIIEVEDRDEVEIPNMCASDASFIF